MNRANKNNINGNRTKQSNPLNIRWMLVMYDLIIYAIVAGTMLVLYEGMDKLSTKGILQQVCLSVLCIFSVRLIGKIYEQVWRYGGIQCYIRLLFTDSAAFIIYLGLELLLPVQKITFARMLSLVSLNLLGALTLRMMYRYAYKCGNTETIKGKLLSVLLHIFAGIEAGNGKEVQKIKVAIIGAGRVGVSLAEELLFRKPLVVSNERTNAYYKNKVVLITGGGGSIGSELCRQLAKMNPKKIIILDIYENGAYDVQQELKIAYGNRLDLQIEICSITHRKALEKVFEKYHPQIIINAAAHKHVPLMEHNCVEAIYNNVFGTQNLVELCEEYGAERFMMVSTDKAVNPTNVMGAL